MRIALIAHDSRKELLAQFCTAYVRILSQNELVATGVTGKVVHDACGLPVRCLYPGARGGAEQISSMIACGEIDMLLFFRDPVNARPNEPNSVTLLRLCDTHARCHQHCHRRGFDPRFGAWGPGLDRIAAREKIIELCAQVFPSALATFLI